MGIEKNRIITEVDEELICPLCDQVFEDPVHLSVCQHDFCRKCLEEHLKENESCPIDELGISKNDLKTNNLLVKFLSKLQVTCQFYGCDQVIALPTLPVHTAECIHNPDLTKACVGGCGVQLAKHEVKSHKCVEVLQKKMENIFNKMESELNQVKKELELTKNNCNIPIGFIYVQLPEQSEPNLLFPKTEWSDVSQEYAGLFFRTVGDSSSQFGQIQDDASPRIVQMVSSRNYNDKNHYDTMEMFAANIDGITRWTVSDKSAFGIFTGSQTNDNSALRYNRFELSITEVRPKNTAVKIWKRIG